MPRAGLTRDRITTVALEMIDEIGSAAFSMRKLGARLGVDPMAVYRHFRNQEDLYDGVAEQLFAQLDLDALPWDSGWTQLCLQYCRRLCDVLLAHPEAVPLFATRPVRSAESIAVGVRMIDLFTQAGFSEADGLRLARSLREFTIGHAMSQAAMLRGSQGRSRKPAPGSPDYNVLAEAADATGIDDHFEAAVEAMLAGYGRRRRTSVQNDWI